MRVFLLVLGVVAFAFGGLVAFGIAQNAIHEIEGLIMGLIGVVAFGSGEIIGAIDKLRDDTVRLHEIERLERQQRDLASKG